MDEEIKLHKFRKLQVKMIIKIFYENPYKINS